MSERLNIFKDARVARAVKAEQERLLREEGLRVSLSSLAASLIQKGLAAGESDGPAPS